jgi:hypothetical protein
MLQFLRGHKTTVLRSIDDFWEYVDSTQSRDSTPDGPESDAEERLDLRMGEAVKTVLERCIGPEEGDNPVQSQNWDWNDDRTRPVYVLRAAFNPEVIPELQGLLNGEFSTFRILLLLQDSWTSDIWGGIVVTRDKLVVQQAVAQAYVLAV